METINLWPVPQQVRFLGGIFLPGEHSFINIEGAEPSKLLFSAGKSKKYVKQFMDLNWQISSSPSIPADLIGLKLQVLPDVLHRPQEYRLTVSQSGISIIGHDLPGVFYGVCTLCQLIQNYGRELPCLQIVDYPDFPARGVMLDISRDRVPTMETLFELVDLLASLKINQFQLYTEHTFAYQNHPLVWEKASPMTGEEILILDAYCRERFVELVPNQNSFGHMHRWLNLSKYLPLAEVEQGFMTPWGKMMGPFSLSPETPGSLELLRDLYNEFLPHFSSNMFNVGCDETFDLGQGKSKLACEEKGSGRVYLDFLLKIHREVSQRGKVMQFWGDIILEHPELIPEIPKNSIALDWGYEADHPFEKQARDFAESGISFYVCPGTSSWNSIAGRTNNTIENLRNSAIYGLKYGAIGYLNTDWGDNGHWQQFPIAHLGYLAGAGFSWSYEASKDGNIPAMLNRFIFQDAANRLGEIAWQLGNVYLEAGYPTPNSSFLFQALQSSRKEIMDSERYDPERIAKVEQIVNQVASSLRKTQLTGEHSDWVLDEFNLTARMILHACKKLRCIFENGNPVTLMKDLDEIMEQFENLWLQRSRPGGLSDSLARFEAIKQDYLSW
jgi:hexosaminidase